MPFWDSPKEPVERDRDANWHRRSAAAHDFDVSHRRHGAELQGPALVNSDKDSAG